MTIIKYLSIFLVFYFMSNMAYWGYQEYIYYEDMQTIRSLSNVINLARVSIDEKAQMLNNKRDAIEVEKVRLDKLVTERRLTEYNALVDDYNNNVVDVNNTLNEYRDLITLHNENVTIINDLIIQSGKRDYLFPIQSYTPELYTELKE